MGTMGYILCTVRGSGGAPLPMISDVIVKLLCNTSEKARSNELHNNHVSTQR